LVVKQKFIGGAKSHQKTGKKIKTHPKDKSLSSNSTSGGNEETFLKKVLTPPEVKRSQRSAIFTRFFGNNIARMREIVAAGLIKLHIGPNALTITGLIFTLAATVLLAMGAGDKIGSTNLPGHSWLAFWAAFILIAACGCDMLDGAVARNRNLSTQMGGFLDSCIDRISDAVVLLGIMIYFLYHGDIAYNNLFAVACVVALTNSELISYTKARAETIIEKCPVGYWQRGERLAAVLIGLFCGHIATVMVMLAILPGFTALRRIIFSCRQIHRQENNLPLIDTSQKPQGINKFLPWNYRRGTLPYDLLTAAHISMILLIDLQRL